jgi:hypothetical protein
MAQARFDNYKKFKLYFSNTFHRKKPVIDASKRPKAAIIREKEVTQSEWQMPYVLPVLM